MDMNSFFGILEEVGRKYPEEKNEIARNFNEVEKSLCNTVVAISNEISNQISKRNFKVDELLKLALEINKLQNDFNFYKETLNPTVLEEVAIAQNYSRALAFISSIKKDKENASTDKINKKINIESSTIKILHNIGIPEQTIGYNLLKSCIVNGVMNPDFVNKITIELLPFVANEYELTKSKALTRIDKSIHCAYIKRNDAFIDVFGFVRRQPPIGKFITTIICKVLSENTLRGKDYSKKIA